jgi:NADH-quinone oxidoreductase subunit K
MTASVPPEHALALAAVLLVLGLIGLLTRRNLVFILLSIEIMLNAAGLAFIAAGARWTDPDGQVMFILILTLAAAEVAVALALLLQIVRRFGTLDADSVDDMRG